MSNIELLTDVGTRFLSILSHLLSRRPRNSKETLLNIRDPNVGFILFPKGSNFSCNVEQVTAMQSSTTQNNRPPAFKLGNLKDSSVTGLDIQSHPDQTAVEIGDLDNSKVSNVTTRTGPNTDYIRTTPVASTQVSATEVHPDLYKEITHDNLFWILIFLVVFLAIILKRILDKTNTKEIFWNILIPLGWFFLDRIF